MPASINGFGTKFYGQAEFLKDESYITTEWACLAHIPIIPAASFRIKRAEQHDVNLLIYNSEAYIQIAELPIFWPQVFRVYGFMILQSALMYIIALGIYHIMNGAETFSPYIVIPIFGCIPIPAGVVWWCRKQARAKAALLPPEAEPVA